MLDFLPGERLKFITVTIVDNPAPELEKIFRVELFNADGGGEKFFFIRNLLLPVLIRAELTLYFALEFFCSFFLSSVCCVPVCLSIQTYLPA